MTQKPLLNALIALLYISGVVLLLNSAPKVFPEEDGVLIPIAMLSIFVFSAASMAYIFLYQPLRLFLEGEKKQAVDLFLKTLLFFAISAMLLVFSGIYVGTQFV